jgi:hypothetical protein
VNQNTTGRIMTRSRARQSKPFSGIDPYEEDYLLNNFDQKDPDQFTIVPAHLKIMKVLVEELQAASGARRDLTAADIEKFDDEGGSGEEGDWEDDPDNFLDLGLGSTKAGMFSPSPFPYSQECVINYSNKQNSWLLPKKHPIQPANATTKPKPTLSNFSTMRQASQTLLRSSML